MKLVCAASIAILITSMLTASFAMPLRAGETRHQVAIDLIEAIDRAEPIDRSALERLIGQKLQCTESGASRCEAHDVDFGGTRVAHLSFRSTREGPILELEKLSGQCVQVGSFMERFRPGQIDNGCTDAVVCLYFSAKRSWGILRASLSDEPATGNLYNPVRCATSIDLDASDR